MTSIVYSNRSAGQFLVEDANKDGLFCIATDNLEEHAEYLDREPVENATGRC